MTKKKKKRGGTRPRTKRKASPRKGRVGRKGKASRKARVAKRKPAKKPTKKNPKVNRHEQMKRVFDRAVVRAEIDGVDAFSASIRNADRSVDGEVRFLIPRGEEPSQFAIEVEQYTRPIPHGFWITVGWRFEPTAKLWEHVRDPKTGRYEVLQGAVSVGAYPQRTGPVGLRKSGQVAENFQTSRQVVERMEEHTKRRPTEMFVRLRYDPHDKQPERVGKRVPKKRVIINRRKRRRKKTGRGNKR